MNPRDNADREQLRKAVIASRDQTAPDRRRYARMVKKFAGVEEGKKNKLRPRLINLLRQSGSVLAMQLSSSRPRFCVEFDGPGPQRSFAKRLEVHLNKLAEEIHLEEVFSTCVLSAFFKIGIAKAQFEETPLLFGADQWVFSGRPSLVPLSYEEYFHDMSARRMSQLAFQGDFYDVVWSRLHDSNLFDTKVADKIRKDAKAGYCYEGESEPTARSAFGFAPGNERSIEDMVRLVDIYLPREKLLVTWPYKMDTPPLRVLKISDPDGPYRLLSFDDVPDNTLPSSPAENEEPLDDLHNSVWRKIAMLVEQMREFFVYEQGFEDDAEAQRTAEHGKYVKVKNLESTALRKIGGVDQNTAATAALISQWYDRMAGNLQLNAGLGAQTPTASQEALLQQNNGSAGARRKYRVTKFAGECGEALKRLLWQDGLSAREAWYEPKSIPGLRVPANWSATERAGRPDQYACSVESYSLTYRTPEQKAAALLGTLNDLAPLMPLFLQGGKTPNPQKILATLSDYRNQPEILEWFDEVEAAPGAGSAAGGRGGGPQAGGAAPSGPGAPPEMRQSPRTEHTTIRQNVGPPRDPLPEILQSMGRDTVPGG